MNNKSNNRFSLVEIIAVLAILGTIGALATFDHSSIAKTFNLVKDSNAEAQELQLAMTRIVKELSYPSADPAIVIDGSNITITTTRDSTSIIFTLSETTITIGGSILLSDVTGFTATKNSTTNAIQITITTGSHSLNTVVYPRTY